jgi:hypothetical protein
VPLIGVDDVDCFVAAGESILNKWKQDTISFVGAVKERTNMPHPAELGAGKRNGCCVRFDGLCLLYECPLLYDTILGERTSIALWYCSAVGISAGVIQYEHVGLWNSWHAFIASHDAKVPADTIVQ